MNLFEKTNQDIEERGYGHGDIKAIRERLRSERHEWERKFDDYLTQMLSSKDEPVPSIATLDAIIARAAYLADARQRLLEERFGDIDRALEESH